MSGRETEQSIWFVDVVLPYEPGLRRWIKSRFSAIRDVDDLIQETFSRILKGAPIGPGSQPASLSLCRSTKFGHQPTAAKEPRVSTRG